MFSRVVGRYDYHIALEKLTRPLFLTGGLVGSVGTAYVCTDPEYGSPRFRDALFWGVVGGTFGMATGIVVAVMHPAIVLSPIVVGPYLYNKLKYHKVNLTKEIVKKN